MKQKRLTAKDLAAASGMHVSTIRRWADQGLLPYSSDWRGTRVFSADALLIAKQLAGVNFDEQVERLSADTDLSRHGKEHPKNARVH